ncbi:unnamed protein product [Adineta steineri]|uniref:Uncharacterized protein n=1 Tax=Adineta steineri TaxID=433720 RepID=A0A815T2K7_9BILA|nr:unnamed protein product [Adineta steineri]
MNAEYITSLYNARLQFGRYVAIPMFFIGFISEFLSIIVFLSLKTFRENSCAFYLLFYQLLLHQWRLQSIGHLLQFIIVKFEVFFHSTCTFGAIIILCLAVIDQYFATCTRVRWQRWSTTSITTSCE